MLAVMQIKQYPREIKAFAAFSTRGQLVWSTIKPTRAETQTAYDRFNPEVDKEYFEILPVFIGIDKGYQYNIEDAINQPDNKQP